MDRGANAAHPRQTDAAPRGADEKRPTEVDGRSGSSPMSDQTVRVSAPSGSPPQARAQSILGAMEVDTRFLGMVGALAVIWIGFHWLSGAPS